MKTVSIVVPTYNEEENVRPLTEGLLKEFKENLSDYNYEILFIDNDSKDGTRPILRELCASNNNIKAIFNLKNFGPDNSPYYGLLQSTGDCSILFCADFQDPFDMIHKMVREWEKGHKVITAIKKKSKENKIVRFFRTIYYRIIRKISDTNIIEHFTGFGLYDRSFLDILRKLDDNQPFLRGVVAEFGTNRLELPYEQQQRRAGKSHIRFLTLYDMVMRSVTSYTKITLRLCTLFGFFVAALCFIIGLAYLVRKLVSWYIYDMGMAAVVIGVFFIGAVQLIFMGIMGEYIMSINHRSMKRPIVIELERINLDRTEELDEENKK